ncbi:hypothetical protein [Salinisphaera sp. LB1]|uniref:hypothetical protein n=1 Tax=Salinisphaera sp. LB1 TaxID=2183911 RepID=UPI000D705939|nr:hypothetical protein [Salinisphaera sp. LB1]AWN17104.1 hypothetical protein SALB1_2908 [Salinisphaera sp. LB1]
MTKFLTELKQQRWDDHRYYHHSRINQSLHLFSACCFLMTYFLVFRSPVSAAITGWFLAMISRQIGHFFFEPKGYDDENEATHEYKESIKVGYNLRRKIVLLSVWALSPIVLIVKPNLFGLLSPHTDIYQFMHNVAVTWICIGIGAVLFRMVQLFMQASIMTGLAWATKIITDPLHDLKLYWKAPLYVLRGDLYDPMIAR